MSDTKAADRTLGEFIARDPNSRYTFDSERDSKQSEICREGGPKGRQCIALQMHSKRLFEAMQEHGFFCALPMEPGKTYMECTPMSR
ncbi:hypothetical protein BD779DRAFT_839178 [Infundibulicybe gibba]|nr:hypothetical protein BD779DRAFT_839178 [Infundibulicybe gibba]